MIDWVDKFKILQNWVTRFNCVSNYSRIYQKRKTNIIINWLIKLQEVKATVNFIKNLIQFTGKKHDSCNAMYVNVSDR